jgi:hypothetical protein
MLFTDFSTAGREKEILGHKMEIKMHLGITNLENNRLLYTAIILQALVAATRETE